MSYSEILARLKETRQNMEHKRTRFHGAQEAIGRAETVLAKFDEESVKYTQADFQEAQTAFEEGDYENAREYADRAAGTAETDLAELKGAREAIGKAESVLSKFEEENVKYAQADFKEAMSAFEKGDYESARGYAETATSAAETDLSELKMVKFERERLDALFNTASGQGLTVDETVIKKLDKSIKNCDLSRANELIGELKQSIEGTLSDMQSAVSAVDDLEKLVSSATSSISTAEFEVQVNEYRKLLDKKQAKKAISKANSAMEAIHTALSGWEPDLTFELPQGLVATEWNKVSIEVTNSGKTHVQSVVVSFEGLKQQGDFSSESLPAGQAIEMVGALMPDAPGSLQVKATVTSNRAHDGQQFESTIEDWLQIARPGTAQADVGPAIREPAPIAAVAELEHRKHVPDWNPPSGLSGDAEILLELFTTRWECYSTWPENQTKLDYLHNNHERLAVSSYFEIPTDPSVVLSEWALPESLRKNVYLDDDRKAHIIEVLASSPEQNYVIIGEPGVGKTTLLFEVFDSFMDKIPTGILTTASLGDAHLGYGMRLFYDDIPENIELVDGILENDTKGIIVTAREADWLKLPEKFQHMFKRLSVPLFSDDDVVSLCHRMLKFSNIRYDEPAIESLSTYAQGSPIFVWLLIREMRFNAVALLTARYVKENSRKGMENYVSHILQKLLKDGSSYKSGGMHSLACMIFLSDYMKDRKCHELFYRSFADVIDADMEELFGDTQSTFTFNQTIAYLSGEGALVRFPHDSWADVLQGTGRMNPLRAEIQSIRLKLADEKFEGYRKQAIDEAWNQVLRRYLRKSVREKDSFLSLADILTANFTLSELEEVGVDVEKIREVTSINADLPIAARILSRIQAAKPTQVTRIINIQDSVINRSTLNLDGADENIEDSIVNRA